MKIYVLVCEKGAAALPLCLLVMSAQKTRKNPPTPPLQNTPNSHFIPCTVHPSLVSSGPVHTLTITLPLTLKPNLPSTLTFPTLRDFLGELELHFARFSLSLSLSLSLSQEMTSISGCKHACLMFFFFFFFLLALCITLLTLLHRESIHLFGWGVVIHRVIYTSYSVKACEIVGEFTWNKKCFVPLFLLPRKQKYNVGKYNAFQMLCT